MPTGTAFNNVFKDVTDFGEKVKQLHKEGKKVDSMNNDEQLQLYGLAKVAQEKNFSEAKKPGMFDLAGKAKYNKWKEYVDAGKKPKEAETEYVNFGKEMLKKYEIKA